MGCKKIINVQNKVKGFYSCTPRRQTVYLWPDVGWPFLWKHFVIFIILNKMFAVRFNDSQRWPPICQKKKSWTQPWRMHEYWWNKKCQPVLLPSLNIDSMDTWHFCRSPPLLRDSHWRTWTPAISSFIRTSFWANLVDTNRAPVLFVLSTVPALVLHHGECPSENKETDIGISCTLPVSLSEIPCVPELSSCPSD